MKVGAAIAENKLPSIDTPAQNMLPNVKGLRGSGISLRNLLNMTSGFAMVDVRLLWPFSQCRCFFALRSGKFSGDRGN